MAFKLLALLTAVYLSVTTIDAVNDAGRLNDQTETFEQRLQKAEQFMQTIQKGFKGFEGPRGPPGFYGKTRSDAIQILQDYIKDIQLELYRIRLSVLERENRLENIRQICTNFTLHVNHFEADYAGEPALDGRPGDLGNPGLPGNKGQRGQNGGNGLDGRNGVNGTKGERGRRGYGGQTGATGAIGPIGLKGDQGAPGIVARRKRQAPTPERLDTLLHDLQLLDTDQLKGDRGDGGDAGFAGRAVDGDSSIVSYMNAYAHEARRAATRLQRRLHGVINQAQALLQQLTDSHMLNIDAIPPVPRLPVDIIEEIVFVPGQRIEFSCQATGLPIPVLWEYGSKVNDRASRVDTEPGHTSLVFENVQEGDADQQYYCCAQNDYGIANITSFVLREAYLDAVLTEEMTTVYPAIGRCFIIACFESEAYPEPTVTWVTVENDTELPIQLSERITLDYNGSLYFTHLEAEDAGTYACVKQNAAARRVGRYTSIQPSQMNGEQPPEEVTLLWSSPALPLVMLGETWRAKCIFSDGGNAGASVIWRALDSELRTGHEIVVPNMRLEDAGSYECAYEAHRQSIERNFTVTVESRPEWRDAPRSLNMAEGDEAVFECRAQSTPAATISWYINTQPITTGTDRVSVSEHTLVFSRVTMDDRCTVQCVAENIHGRIVGSAYLNVVGVRGPAGAPGAPGLSGLPGESGTPGEPGDPGVPGNPGLQGRPGMKGQTGDTGFAGIHNFVTGWTGAIGPRGPKGDTGPLGNLEPLSERRGIRRRAIEGDDMLHRIEEIETLQRAYTRGSLRGDPGPPGPRGPQGKTLNTNSRTFERLSGSLREDHSRVQSLDELLHAADMALDESHTVYYEKQQLYDMIRPGGLPRGPPGVAGTKGAKGYPGQPGRRGEHGDSGFHGTDGTPGNDAVPGDAGEPGLPGRTGRTGRTGARGRKGYTGDTGPIAS